MGEVSAEQIGPFVVEELSKLAEVEQSELTHDAKLEELDVDSLDLVELGQVVEDRYGIQLEREDMKDVSTVGDVIDVIVRRAGSSEEVGVQ
jgi:acyl carrier protein